MPEPVIVDVVLPSLGESVAEATVTKWLVKAGDVVKENQVIVEMNSVKADVEVVATTSGRIAQILAEPGQTLQVGALLARIEEGSFSAAPAPAPAPAAESASSPPLASPSARQLARDLGVDLKGVTATGEHGRITHDDVQRAAAPAAPAAPAPAAPVAPAAPAAPAPVAAPPKAPAPAASQQLGPPVGGFGAFKLPPYNPKPGDEVVPFSPTRRITADHMVYSKLTSPHVVTVAEVDLHRVMKLREQHKDQYKKEGVSLTVLAFVCAAVSRALRAFPGVNARVLDGALVKLRDINLGVAVDSPKGLVVPNIKNADELSLKGMARAIGELAGRARSNKLTPDDFSGATFTVTNPGPKGNLFGGAIISQPNVGILRMGEIKKRVVVVEEDGEDRIVIHPVMYMALSYDHRVIDGVLGNEFLWTLTDLLRKGQFEA